MSQFKFVANFFHTPSTPLLRLEDLGSFQTSPNVWKHLFYITKRAYRRTHNPTLYTLLRKVATLRAKVTALHQMKKFKKRFGSWHWK